MGEEHFARLQRRRSQTEGRIGIFKNSFVGRPLRAKGFEPPEVPISWQVLTHNLWVLARLEQKVTLTQAAGAQQQKPVDKNQGSGRFGADPNRGKNDCPVENNDWARSSPANHFKQPCEICGLGRPRAMEPHRDGRL
jgi:hypothetical protein